MTMRERLARALLAKSQQILRSMDTPAPDYDELGIMDQRALLVEMDAVLSELREPNQAMDWAAMEAFCQHVIEPNIKDAEQHATSINSALAMAGLVNSEQLRKVWRASIDAARNEEASE